MTVRVRFAPSPTGYLHIGAARSALFNWLFARKAAGKFLLRVEDTDLQRSTDESTRSILEGMAWLGIGDYDEEIVFQSHNADKHRAAAVRLIEEGKAYRDFTPKGERADANIKQEIAERARSQSTGEGTDHRANTFRDLPLEESNRRAGAGEPFAVRLKISREGQTRFIDAVYGEQAREHSEIEDLVLLRSGDLSPLYNLSVVVDDIEMGITHVIRGQDHLTNTHKQVLIYEALGVAPPTFAHLPLILAPNKAKLSKRKHGEVVSLTTYRDRGFVPAAFRNYLALMGWSPGEANKEIMSLEKMVEQFSLEGVHRSNAVFNFSESDARQWTDQKALWMNAEYIRTMPMEELLPMVRAELETSGLWKDEFEESISDNDEDSFINSSTLSTVMGRHDNDFVDFDELLPERVVNRPSWFEQTVELIRQRFHTLKDFTGQGRAYFADDFDLDAQAVAKNLKKESRLKELLPGLADSLERVEPWTTEAIETALREFAESAGVKAGLLINASRTALTGQSVGPSMFDLFEVIGRERSAKRLRDAAGLV